MMNPLDFIYLPTRKAGKAPIVIAPAVVTAVMTDNVITLELAVSVLGLTRAAMEAKIRRGVWVEDRQYHRDPTGGIWINRKGVRQWVGAAAA